jgi:hypothetical protein
VVEMKKSLFVLILVTSLANLTGCNIKSTDLPLVTKKPNTYYYTKLLSKQIESETKWKGILLETNLHKEIELTSEGIEVIKGFLKNIKTKNFIEKPTDLPKKPQYRIYISGNNEKYVINVYNENLSSVQPWDGVYSMDYIDMSSVYALYNLHGLCKHLFK